MIFLDKHYKTLGVISVKAFMEFNPLPKNVICVKRLNVKKIKCENL